jgi:hypothetical protein
MSIGLGEWLAHETPWVYGSGVPLGTQPGPP